MTQAMPNDRELELSLLAAVNNFPEHAAAIFEALQPSDFYADAHAAYFEEAKLAYSAEAGFDSALFVTRIHKHAKREALLAIQFALPIGFHPEIDVPIGILKDLSAARTVVAAAFEVASEGVKPDSSREPGEFLDRAEHQLSEALEGRSTKATSESSADVMTKVFERITQPKAASRVRLTSGLASVDRLIGGFEPTKFILVAGRPGKGKSAAAMKIAVENAKRGTPIGWFSLEMDTAELGERELSYEAHVDGYKLREVGWGMAKLERDEWARMQTAGSRLADLPIRHDYCPGITWEDLARKIRREHKQYGIKGAIIDYLQLLHSSKSYDSRREELASISHGCVALAGQLKIPIIAMAQLNRESVKGGVERRPSIADLGECGAFEQDANMVVLLYRPEPKPGQQPQPPEWVIDKNRGGPTGIVRVHFRPEYTRFDDLQYGEAAE